ncbi:MAG: T9SS type A sorting domain-containing protein, partial [Bacteroidota bacterium]
ETLDLCYGDLFDGQIYTEDAVVNRQYQSQAGCDSLVAYRIMVSENIETTVSAEICQGDTYELAGLLYTDAGNYQAELQAAEGCDSTVNLNLAVLPTYDLEQIVDLCYGDLFNGQIYTEDAVVDKQYQSQAGCDSLITYRIAVSDKIETNLVANICQGEQYEFGGITYEDAGNYRTTLTAASGCDSTVQLALTVDPSYEVDQIVGLCFGGTFDGQVYTNNATVDRTYQSVAGCDSLVHYDIQVSDDILINIDAAICMGESYQLGAETYTAAGKYTAAFQAVGGCDSTVVVDLAVLPTYEQTAAVSLCYGGQFDGQTYTSDADIQKLFHTVNGCDSLVYYDIDVAELLESDLTASICDGATYALGNETFALAGNYEVVFSAKNGCDSTVHLSLEVAPVYEIEQTVSLCFGGTFDGQVYTSNATVNKQFQSVFGCDSLVQYQIEVFDNIETDVAASICQGETYQLGLETYSQSGNYTAVLQASGGCDSTVMLALEVFPVYEQTQNLELCFGERYNGTAYFADTSLVESYTTAAGCDSNWTIHLQVFDRVVTNLNESVCQGEFFELDGERYGEEGIYTAMFENNSGCDSTVVLELSILPVYESEENITLSPTEPYAGQTFASDTTIVLQLTAINGCDSLATVNISILTTSILTPSFDEEIRLFPNPTTDQSKLQLTGFPSGKIEWFLVDITGKEVWSKQQNHITKEGSFEELLELGDLPPGIYTLILKTDLGVFSRKVLKL